MSAAECGVLFWGLLALIRVFSKKKRGTERALIMMMLFILLVKIEAKGQNDNRWRLVPGIDSLVTGPLSDIRYMAGLRAAKNQQQRDCAWMLARREAELMAMRDARIVMQKALDKSQRTINEAMDQAERLNERANKAERKAKRRQPWAYVAAGVIGGFILNNSTR